MKRITKGWEVWTVVCLMFTSIVFTDSCQADWFQFQKDKINSGQTQDLAPITSPYVAWSSFTHYAGTHGIDVTPIIAEGKVFTVDVDEYAWAFDIENGNALWSTPLMYGPRYNLATPAYGEGKVFFATSTGYIYALNGSNGGILWSGKLTEGLFQEEELTTQIVYTEGKVYVGSWEGVYYCLDAAGEGTDPKILWEYQIDNGGYDWWSGPAVIGDYILFGDTESVIVSLDKDTAAPKDDLNLSQHYGIEAGSIRSAIVFNSSLNRIYLTSKNGYVFAVGFDSATGNFDTSDGWLASAGIYSASTPAFYDGRLFVCTGSFCKQGSLLCLNEADGTLLWSHEFGSYGSEASPALSIQNGEPFIYIATDTANGAFYCFNKDGQMMWEHIPDHPEYILQGAAISGGKVFFGNDAGYLYCLETAFDWDVNCDGSVNVLDLTLIGQHFGETGEPGWIREDINDDGSINVGDMILVGQHWCG